jgi:hypothetical protein
VEHHRPMAILQSVQEFGGRRGDQSPRRRLRPVTSARLSSLSDGMRAEIAHQKKPWALLE